MMKRQALGGEMACSKAWKSQDAKHIPSDFFFILFFFFLKLCNFDNQQLVLIHII